MPSVSGMDPALTREERDPSGCLAQQGWTPLLYFLYTSDFRGYVVWLLVNVGLYSVK